MDIFRMTALVNLSILILFFIIGIIIQLVSGTYPIGVRKNGNKFMSFLIFFSISLLIFLWISYIINLSLVKNIVTLSFVSRIIIITLISILVMCFAALIEIIAGINLGTSFRIHSKEENEPVVLITKGIYGIIRNPVVSGIFIYSFSVTLLIPNIISILMLIMVLISYNYKVDIEARELKKRLGPEWDYYCQNTGKYFPKFINKSR